MTTYVLVALLGVAAGMLSVLVGVGGGIIFVPTLVLLVGLTQVGAEATSLLAIIPVAVLGAWLQRGTGDVRLRDAGWMGAGAVVTVIAGALVADHLPERVLRILFAGLLLFVAAHTWRRAGADARDQAADDAPGP